MKHTIRIWGDDLEEKAQQIREMPLWDRGTLTTDIGDKWMLVIANDNHTHHSVLATSFKDLGWDVAIATQLASKVFHTYTGAGEYKYYVHKFAGDLRRLSTFSGQSLDEVLWDVLTVIRDNEEIV